jgi:membrane protein implicated in regulation of membrane protease activity
MHLLLTTYKVAPMTFWDYFVSFAIVFVLILYICKVQQQLNREKRRQELKEQRAQLNKRYKRNTGAPSLPSKPITV